MTLSTQNPIKDTHVQVNNFVSAMSGAVTQVSVVTTEGEAGRFGVTISAFASVSAEPPMVLICVNKRSPAVAGIERNGCFCVNLLGHEQSEVANCFAGRASSGENFSFDCADWGVSETGSPILMDAAANFDCTVEAAYDAGTHRILIGRVVEATATQHAPLAFSQRAFQTLQPLQLN
jgi:flavin reductase